MPKHESENVVGVSGPTGAGKDYLSNKAREILGLPFVTMVTTRPVRPPGAENKKPISLEEYQRLLSMGRLIGHHEEESPNGPIFYAYDLEDIQTAGSTILELNPVKQIHIVDELRNNGIVMAAWIGLYGDEDYLKHNIDSRQQMSPEDLESRMRLSREIVEYLRSLHEQGIVTTLFKVGWENRATMRTEFADLVSSYLKA